jgi:hypothetical protein
VPLRLRQKIQALSRAIRLTGIGDQMSVIRQRKTPSGS